MLVHDIDIAHADLIITSIGAYVQYLEHSLVIIDHFPCDVTVCGSFDCYSTNRGWGDLGVSHVRVMYCSL